MNDSEIIKKAGIGKQFMDDVFVELFAKIRSNYLDKFCRLESSDIDKMTEINLALKNLEKVKQELEDIITDGKQAEKRLK